MNETFHVYIMTNNNRTLYIGMSGNLGKRVFEYKEQLVPGFTRRYGLDRLVYAEQFEDPETAIVREKTVKGWTRARKIALIESTNPHWEDLSFQL